MLEYSIAIVTRNRPKALALSIPRMLNQSRPPAQIIVADSSENHNETRKAVLMALGDTKVEAEILETPRGCTVQRNTALQKVKHPIVFFPDDDSIWFNDTASLIMDVYQNDRASRIAAVCGIESPLPPDDFEAATTDYQMRDADRFRQSIASRRLRFQSLIAQDPAAILGQALARKFQLSDWEIQNQVVPTPWMTGFRMSFRTETARKSGFNENLTDYCLFEDIDASFNAWRDGGVVAVKTAKIFHFKSPERRGDGWILGFTQLLNKAYIIVRHTQPGDPARAAVHRFAQFKLAQYVAGLPSVFGRQRFQGAVAAYGKLANFVRLPRDLADKSYREIFRAVVESRISARTN